MTASPPAAIATSGITEAAPVSGSVAVCSSVPAAVRMRAWIRRLAPLPNSHAISASPFASIPTAGRFASCASSEIVWRPPGTPSSDRVLDCTTTSPPFERRQTTTALPSSSTATLGCSFVPPAESVCTAPTAPVSDTVAAWTSWPAAPSRCQTMTPSPSAATAICGANASAPVSETSVGASHAASDAAGAVNAASSSAPTAAGKAIGCLR
jgi:hypothetical protein